MSVLGRLAQRGGALSAPKPSEFLSTVFSGMSVMLTDGRQWAAINTRSSSDVDAFCTRPGVRFLLASVKLDRSLAGMPSAQDIAGSRVLWFAIKGRDADTLQRLQEHDYAPSYVIDDGDAHLTAIWLLDPPCTETSRIERVNRDLARAFGSRDHESCRVTFAAPVPNTNGSTVVKCRPGSYRINDFSALADGPKRRVRAKASDDALAKAGEEQSELLAELNAAHAVLEHEASKCAIVCIDRNPQNDGRITYRLQSFSDFRNRYLNRKVNVASEGELKTVPLGDWWIRHPERRQFLAFTFVPGSSEERIDNHLNLWRGWGVEPRRGDWSLMRAHVRDVIAGGDSASFEYVQRWCAWAVQNPGRQAEVALVLRGPRGAGKGLFCHAVRRLFGQHGLSVSSPGQLTGKFNGHMRDCCLLFADEAIAPGDKAAESVLKALITEPTLSIEGKGKDVVPCKNMLHVVMASNDAWVIPAGIDERRFCVLDVSASQAQNETYFAALVAELDNGGLAAMLHDLLALQIGDWHPRRGIPKTSALAEQKLLSLRGAEHQVLRMLQSGTAHGCLRTDGSRVFVSTRLCYKALGLQSRDETALGRALGKATQDGRSARVWNGDGHESLRGFHRGHWLPRLADARALWATAMRINVEWPSDDGDWDQIGEEPERSF